jgi:SAM-dependent methyltransferase
MTHPVPVRQAYAGWAESYDTDANATRDLDAALLRRAALPLDGAEVVEFGAGTGKNTAYLAARAASVIALDLSEAMLERARRRGLGDHVRFVTHDVTRPWPLAAGAADLVIGNLVLEHVADFRPVFAEARRVLRPGGLLYVAELHPYRQLRGAGARFRGAAGEVRVEAYVHAVSDYVSAALAAGLALTGMAQVGDEDRPAGAEPALPRLLQLSFAAPRP